MKKLWVMNLTSLASLMLSAGAMAGEFPQATPDCLDLAAYLGEIRRSPDSMYLHRILLDLSVSGKSPAAPVSDLANRHALDLFDHPDLTTFGIAAAKTGSTYEHQFSAYQYDCNKVVTGNIFSLEGLAITWEIINHSASQLTLQRLTAGGEAEVSDDLALIMRQFQAYAPSIFTVTSVYRLKTRHACATPVIETNAVIVTELYAIDQSSSTPVVPANPRLLALQSRYPRLATSNDRRGDYTTPLSAKDDSVCAPPSTGILKVGAFAQ